ncbi:hypothetical protein RUM44_006985 [Polyplax serrata]|uniref:K Homology domain-containing protein n=1 Tax=Polyplax serrata TaxID=468196 RepID=A0ABR1AZE6_POLSC
MDVLSPDLLWIDDRCYRIHTLGSDYFGPGSKSLESEEVTGYDLNMCAENFDEDGDDKEVLSLIQTISEGRLELSLPIPQAFWSQIIGVKGVTKKRIESDTNTRIQIPRPLDHGDVIIRGSSIKDIILAKKCIDAVVSSSRQKLTFTHFVSVPTNSDEIKRNFMNFKEEILRYFGNDRGVDESIFQNPNKLHLTISTLVLADQRERKVAEVKLNEICDQKIKPLLVNRDCKQLKLEMKGIEYMNDDPAEVDVLYGKIESKPDANLLQYLTNIIVEYFTQHKLIKASERQDVKLHVTLMNTLFREEEPEEINQEIAGLKRTKTIRKQRSTFNAVNILQKFQNYYFGQQDLKTIELSVRFSTGKNGYYKSSAVVHV